MITGAQFGPYIVNEQAHSFIKNTVPSLEKLFGYHFRNPDNCVLAFLTSSYWATLLGKTSPILLRDSANLKWSGHLDNLISMGYKSLGEIRLWCSIDPEQPLYEMRDSMEDPGVHHGHTPQIVFEPATPARGRDK